MRSDFVARAAVVLLGAALLLAAVGSVPARGAARPVTGTFVIESGSCDGDGASGSYFRMILPTGTADGPYVSNGDSTCSDQTYTLLRPGRDGGLQAGRHQPQPSPPFDADGNGLADRITQPTAFFGVEFAVATNPTDPQTGTDVPAPSIERSEDGTLSGDLRAFAAAWNGQHFNQGAPKPSGAEPGLTAAPSGTLDAGSGAFTLEWRSQIEGGPFDNFTGVWHLEGTVETDADAASGDGADDTADGGGSEAPATSARGSGSTTGDAPSTAAPDESPTGPDTDDGADAGGADGSGAGTGDGDADGTGTDGTDIDADGASASAPGSTPSGGEAEEVAVEPTLAGGREPAGWLVIVVALAGLVALGAFVVSDRAIRRAEVDR